MIPLAVPNMDGREATYCLRECIDSTFVSAGTTGIERSEGGNPGAERRGVRDDEMLAEAKAHGTAVDRRTSGLADVGTPTIDILPEYPERPPLVPRRQTAEAAYSLNGAVIAVSAGQIRDGRGLLTADTVAVSMGERSIDVDTQLDLAGACLLARDHHDLVDEPASAPLGDRLDKSCA